MSNHISEIYFPGQDGSFIVIPVDEIPTIPGNEELIERCKKAVEFTRKFNIELGILVDPLNGVLKVKEFFDKTRDGGELPPSTAIPIGAGLTYILGDGTVESFNAKVEDISELVAFKNYIFLLVTEKKYGLEKENNLSFSTLVYKNRQKGLTLEGSFDCLGKVLINKNGKKIKVPDRVINTLISLNDPKRLLRC